MALRGNLKDFSLPDVFQLVTFSRKTGVLRIARSDGAEGTVWFRDGEVFFASSNWHSELLGERLVKAQRITAQALKRALELRAAEPENGRRLGQILVGEGYITDKVLEAFVSEQIQETIFDLMRWDEGDFDFEAMPEVVEEDIGLTVSIENVVMEGSRRLEEWNRIRKKIPSMDVVFKMATAPGEGTFEISLKPMEWQLLLLIDGTRSVADLAVTTNRTDFDVARIVYGLFSAGLLEFATEEEIEHNRAERAEREARLAEIESARKAEEEAARQAALEREAKLAAEAETRREAEEQAERDAALQAEKAAKAEAEAVEAAKALRTEPEEEPEFLGGGAIAPSAADAAALEEFMGAVLEKPVAEPVIEQPAAQAPSPEPYVPVEEPAFMSAPGIADSELPLMPVSSVEDLLGIERAPAIEEPAEEPAVEIEEVAPEVELEFTEEPEAVAELEPAEPLAEELPAPEEPAAELGFETELLAMGLGELPSDLLAPLGEEMALEQVQVPLETEEVAPVEMLEPEPELVVEPVEPPAADFALEPVSEPMSELPAQIEPLAPEPIDELAELVGSLELPSEVPTAPIVEPMEEVEEPDFSELLESLDIDAQPVEEAAAPSPAAAGFDEELLREEEAEAPTGGVISTDAFLEDISIDDLGFSGGLTDELSALTGAERKQPARPQASVNAIPDQSAAVLKRDARVDKDTLLKIIDGIQNL